MKAKCRFEGDECMCDVGVKCVASSMQCFS